MAPKKLTLEERSARFRALVKHKRDAEKKKALKKKKALDKGKPKLISEKVLNLIKETKPIKEEQSPPVRGRGLKPKKTCDKPVKELTAKDIHERKLIEYLSDPNSKPLTRGQLSTKILGFKNEISIHGCFTKSELVEIEWKALDARRRQYAGSISEIDKSLIKRAKSGDSNAIKLAYQRFEGWAPAKELKLKGDMTVTISPDDAGCL